MSQDNEDARQLNAKLTGLKKEFHASTGLAIGALNDTISAILGEIFKDSIRLQSRLDLANKEIERLKKFEPKKKPEPMPPEPKKKLPSTTAVISETYKKPKK